MDLNHRPLATSASAPSLSYLPMNGSPGWTRTSDLPHRGAGALSLSYRGTDGGASDENDPGWRARRASNPLPLGCLDRALSRVSYARTDDLSESDEPHSLGLGCQARAIRCMDEV